MNVRLLLLINGWAGKNHILDNFMVFCAKDLIYVFFLTVIVWAVYAYKREPEKIIFFFGNLLLAFILLQVASQIYVDHRPFVDYRLVQLIPHAAGKSFPSDHTTAAFAIVYSFLLFTSFRKTAAIMLVAAALIGFARIFTGLHYPVDIAGAILVASIGAAITWLISTKVGNRSLVRR